MKKFTFSLLMTIFLFGCSMQDVENVDKISNIIFQNTFKEVENKYGVGKIRDLNIREINQIDNATFGNLTFYRDDILYEGIFYVNSNNWNVEQIEVTRSDSTVITIFQLRGHINEKPQRDFIVTSGFINNSKVKSVNLIYEESRKTAIILGNNQKMYLDARVGTLEGPKKIIALDDDGSTLFVKSLKH